MFINLHSNVSLSETMCRIYDSGSMTSLKRLSLQLLTFFNLFYYLFKSFVKVELIYVSTISLLPIAETARKSEISYKNGCVGNYLRPSNNYRQLILT